jgi:hypothetical protein
MSNTRLLAGLSVVAVAVGAAFASAASAQQAQSTPFLGANFINFEGYKYGGMLPVGADKNPDALRILIRAANSLGQMRDNQYQADPKVGGYYLVLGDTSLAMRIDGDGTWNGQKAHVVLDWDYGTPGIRLDVSTDGGKTHQIQVAANNLAWDEKSPGVYSGPAQTSVQERLILAYLMPSEAMLELRDGLLSAKASKAGARDVTTVAVPRLGAGVNNVITFDADGHPVHSEIALNGHTYTGDFDEFLADRMDMAVNFSHHVVLKVDGKETANLELNWHQVNPYVIFPVPKEVAAK